MTMTINTIPLCGPNEEDSSSTSSPPEWAMLELNGELVMPKDLSPANENDENDSCTRLLGKDRVELGAVRFTKEGKPVMTLGSHELKGNIVTLKQPFAVMKKRKRLEEGNEESVDYQVVGVITKKLLFDQYPKSIMRQTL